MTTYLRPIYAVQWARWVWHLRTRQHRHEDRSRNQYGDRL